MVIANALPTSICHRSGICRRPCRHCSPMPLLRARQAGFDGVELHYAHAYTMASFLSALNTRDDGYGGDLAGRVRLPLEVYEAVRGAVGGDFVVGCRFLSEECIKNGTTVEEAASFGVDLARAGMDFLSLSRGGKFEDARQPKVGGGGVSLHRSERL